MLFEHAIHTEYQPARLSAYEEYLQETALLERTIQEIEDNLAAPDFNTGDQAEVQRNLEFFKARHEELNRKFGYGALVAAEAAA